MRSLLRLIFSNKIFWLGIGQGKFSEHYFNELKNTNFDDLDPFLKGNSDILKISAGVQVFTNQFTYVCLDGCAFEYNLDNCVDLHSF